MNDTLEKTSSSSLAVVEKKPQRSGGCVGVFFQLFDWNRRFAKKKLFSRKLLPPVRLKQASKKFGGDEKQPKLRLIADENSGGFPTTKNNNGVTRVDNEQHQETRVPGLVARLMGLESMPALQRDKSRKIPAPSYSRGKADKFVDNVNSYSRNELNADKGVKHELRPQKLQKTSVAERQQPVARFGAENLPFKNVLSKSRKHHPKLPSPVKSPKNVSKKSSSKLIGAATRILEPGLQTSRSKCAITYHPLQNTIMEERAHSVSRQLENSDAFEGIAANEPSSCRNCGYRLDNLDSKPVVSEKPLIFASPFANCVGPSCQGSKRSKFYQEELHEDYPTRVGSFDGDLQSHIKFTSQKSPFSGSIHRNSSSQNCKHPKPLPLSLNSNHKTQSQFQSNNVNGTRNFVSVNPSSSSNARPRLPARIGNGKFDPEKRVSNGVNDSVPPGRKRRPANNNVSRQGESADLINSTVNKRNFDSPHNAHFINRQCSRNGLLDLPDRTVENSQTTNNVVSFAFNSPMKQKSGIQCDDSLPNLAFGENGRRTKLEKPFFPLSGDALGALLQQKLEELSCEGEDIGDNASRKTTSMILQELICALTSDKPFQPDNLPAISDKRNSWFNHSKLSNSVSSTSSQGNAMAAKLSVELPVDSERPSPGSVLEAYFSTESCHSSSLDESLGCKMLNESTDFSYSAPRSPNLESELFDSAASTNYKANNTKESVIDILNHVSEILCCDIFANCGCLKGNSKLDVAKDALLNAELVLHSASHSGTVVGKGCIIKHLLLHELETLASVLWMNFGNSLGTVDCKEANQLKIFALDSIVEYLDERFGGYYPQCGSNVSRKLPLRMNANTLIFEIVEVVRKWDEASRYDRLDELIEREMEFSLREWTECETEAFETGVEISRTVLGVLVDEIVMDLWK